MILRHISLFSSSNFGEFLVIPNNKKYLNFFRLKTPCSSFCFVKLNCFMILMVDDYHNVHTKKVPTKLITSTAIHMASCLLDIHPTITAIARPRNTPIHRPVKIKIKGEEVVCYGGIEIDIAVQKMHQALVNMRKPFMQQVPSVMLQLSPKQLQESLRQLRQESLKTIKFKLKQSISSEKKYLM